MFSRGIRRCPHGHHSAIRDPLQSIHAARGSPGGLDVVESMIATIDKVADMPILTTLWTFRARFGSRLTTVAVGLYGFSGPVRAAGEAVLRDAVAVLSCRGTGGRWSGALVWGHCVRGHCVRGHCVRGHCGWGHCDEPMVPACGSGRRGRKATRFCSSVVERVLGKDEVMGSSPIRSFAVWGLLAFPNKSSFLGGPCTARVVRASPVG
jgi:hypothetical protein